MRELYLAAFSVTSVTATGALLVVTGTEVIAALVVQNAIGATTPIDGITVGVVAVGIVAGVGFLWTGAKQLLSLGAYIAKLTDSVETSQETATALRKVSDHMDQMTAQMKHIDARLKRIEEEERRTGND